MWVETKAALREMIPDQLSNMLTLQDIDVIDHWEWNEIDVHAGGAGARTFCTSPTPNYRRALSIDENQSFFGQQTTQIGYDAAITAAGNVLVDGRAHLLRQLREQVGCVVNAQFLDVFSAIGINRIRSRFFRRRNI